MGTLLTTPVAPGTAPPRGTRGRRPLRREGRAGWLFLAPTLIVLGLFMVLPILMALWVSVSDWTGNGSPFSSRVHFVGGDNYEALLAKPGLTRQNFATSIRNNGYFVLFVVPLQTALALFLAVTLHQKKLKGRQFFRTAFYFPTVTSSVAISVVFLFLFSSTGTVNAALKLFGVDGPSWFADPRGLFHLALGDPANPPAALAGHGFLGLSCWDWLAGPRTGRCSTI